MLSVAFDHDVGFQETEDEPQNLAVLNAAAYPFHQHMMVDSVKAALDIPFDDIARP